MENAKPAANVEIYSDIVRRMKLKPKVGAPKGRELIKRVSKLEEQITFCMDMLKKQGKKIEQYKERIK